VDGGIDEKRMRLRYAGTCRVCGSELPARAEAIYERATRTVRCVSHEVSTPNAGHVEDVPNLAVPEVVDPGTAGASARREFDRRKAAREERIRARHPKLGGLILAVSDDPQSTTAWNTGALGEERLGGGLNQLASETVRFLHDRRMPRSKANIDHLAVTPTGVYVIDAKKYRGRPHLKIDGGLFRPRVERLMIGSRDCTKLVDGVLKQVDVVRGLLEPGVPVHGVLCFVEADWPLLGGNFTTRDVHALWPKKLYPKLQAEGPLTAETIAEIHRTLAKALPAS
jgi:Nuclease-related domain